MHAYLIDKKNHPITDDIVIESDSDFVEMIHLAREQNVTCAIKWHRPSDGQTAYWAPNGASLQPHWYNGNQNAAKDDGATSHLHLRCTPAEKATWVRAAGGTKLAEWVKSTLNAAATNFKDDQPTNRNK